MSRDAEPAFPCPEASALHFGNTDGYMGMTLRDYFAAMALSGELAGQTDNRIWMDKDIDRLARFAYLVSDAMLFIRAKNE